MKYVITIITLLALASPATAQIIIGSVNVKSVIGATEDGKKLRAYLRDKFNLMQEEIKGEENELRKEQASLPKPPYLTAEQSQQVETFQKKVRKLQAKTQQYQKQIEQLEQEKMAPILARLRTVIDSVCMEAGALICVEEGSSAIISIDPKAHKNLSQQVIQAYEAKHGQEQR